MIRKTNLGSRSKNDYSCYWTWTQMREDIFVFCKRNARILVNMCLIYFQGYIKSLSFQLVSHMSKKERVIKINSIATSMSMSMTLVPILEAQYLHFNRTVLRLLIHQINVLAWIISCLLRGDSQREMNSSTMRL